MPRPEVRQDQPDLSYDKFGNPTQKICPVAYFPCYQDGYFCFRPIYCKGKFSPEGSGNAAVILGGTLLPAFQIWKQKSGVEPDPNTPEGMAYYKKRYNIAATTAVATPIKAHTSFFNRATPSPATPPPPSPNSQMKELPGYATKFETVLAGEGAAVSMGKRVTVHATGRIKESGKTFWSTRDPGQQVCLSALSHAKTNIKTHLLDTYKDTPATQTFWSTRDPGQWVCLWMCVCRHVC